MPGELAVVGRKSRRLFSSLELFTQFSLGVGKVKVTKHETSVAQTVVLKPRLLLSHPQTPELSAAPRGIHCRW